MLSEKGENEKANCFKALSYVRLEPLFLLHTCEEKYNYYKDVANSLMNKFFLPIQIK